MSAVGIVRYLAGVLGFIALSACSPSAPAEPEAREKAQSKQGEDEISKHLDAALREYAGESSGRGSAVVRPPEFFVYRKTVQQRLRESLTWEEGDSDLVAEVFFVIDRRGVVSDIALRKSSGNPDFDEAAVGCVRKSNPLPPPPESVYVFFRNGFQVRIRSRK